VPWLSSILFAVPRGLLANGTEQALLFDRRISEPSAYPISSIRRQPVGFAIISKRRRETDRRRLIVDRRWLEVDWGRVEQGSTDNANPEAERKTANDTGSTKAALVKAVVVEKTSTMKALVKAAAVKATAVKVATTASAKGIGR
jgi:hypothetical protein